MEEIWKPIIENGINTRYEISNHGRVKSFQNGKEIILKTYKDGRGYHRIYLYLNGERYARSIHRLVGIYFIPNPENKPEVNHKYGDKDNNHVDYLEWNTGSENTLHAFAMGLRKPKYGNEHPHARRVGKYFAGILLKEYETLSSARVDGYTAPCLCDAARNNKCYKGFYWKYLN